MSQDPPLAPKIANKRLFHGRELSDPYAWLRDPNYPKVEDETIIGHLQAENAHYEDFFEPHQKNVNALYEELIARIKQDDSSVPYAMGPYHYHWKFEAGAQYRQWFRAKTGEEPDVILDEVALAEGLDFFRVGGMSVSPDHKLLAFSSDTDGSERYTITVVNLDTSESLTDKVVGCSGSITWGAKGDCFVYVLLSEEHRPYRVMLHTLGTRAEEDQLVYEEADPSFFVGASKTLSRKFVTIQTGDHQSSEVHVLDAHKLDLPPKLVCARREGHEYSVDDAGPHFLIRTNDKHRNFRIVQCSYDNVGEGGPGESEWTEVIAPSDNTYITNCDCFASFFVLEERIAGQEQIRVQDYGGDCHRLAFPEPTFTAHLGTNAEFETATLRINYESMVTPPSVSDYAVSERKFTLLKEQIIPSGYDKAKYQCERLMAPSHDGKQIPISIVYRRDLWDGERGDPKPLHLYAYGAYGMGMSPYFSTSRLSLLDRGLCFAIAHIRGGDEMGYHWYEEGKRERRKNTFHDFVSCAEHLISEGYTARGEISISGGSAGGTLMGVMNNWRPDLWKAIVAHVPFVDVLNTMLDDTLPLTPIEWPEWGNPLKDDAAFDYIHSYSPYENATANDMPAMLVTAGLNDPRVTYWEPAKWVARLRELKTNNTPLLFKTNMGAGHGGKSGRFESYHELAEEYTFVLDAFGKL